VQLTLKAKPHAMAANAGLYIVAAYWFTASTSFANPAVTLARSLTNTFAGIRPDDVAVFIVAQLVGAICGLVITLVLAGGQQSKSNEASCFPPAAPGPERI
jgi:glycerol uptake facilitator-like aquaporin